MSRTMKNIVRGKRLLRGDNNNSMRFQRSLFQGGVFSRTAMTRKMIALGVARTPKGMKKTRDIAGLLMLSVIHLLGSIDRK